MREPGIPDDEPERLASLRALDILDTASEERFDRFTRLAQRLFGVSIALVSLVDEKRQWFKSRRGLAVTETPRDISFCGHAIANREPLIVPDALTDPRFADNPLVVGEPNVRFYAGWPLHSESGRALGTLCLIDPEPRVLDQEAKELMAELAGMVEHEFRSMRELTTDELSGLSNRRGFTALATRTLNVCHRLRGAATLLFIDLDGFKAINDTYGHAAGDRALVAFSHELLRCFRDADVIARISGDEFAVLLTGADAPRARIAIDRFRVQIDEFNAASADPWALRFSTGVAGYDPQDKPDLDDLLSAADALMYESKRRHPDRGARSKPG